jgi:predicted CopG family antitoxin
MTKTAKTITVDDKIWEKVKQHAKDENRPLSNFIETILIKYFKEKEEKK